MQNFGRGTSRKTADIFHWNLLKFSRF